MLLRNGIQDILEKQSFDYGALPDAGIAQIFRLGRYGEN